MIYLIGSIFVVLGLVGGVVVGILGAGSSLVILPVLSILFPKMGISNSVAMHMAAGTCIATLFVACAMTCLAKIRHGEHPDWNLVKILAPAAIFGAILGASVAHFIPGHILKLYIAILILLIGIKMLFKSKRPTKAFELSALSLFVLTFLICSITAVAGIAIGILLVPLLCKCGCDIKEAIFNSVLITLFYTVAGSITFILNGLTVQQLPAYSLGYVYLPAFIVISIATCFGTPIGVKLAKKIPASIMHYGFAAFLLLAGLNLLFG